VFSGKLLTYCVLKPTQPPTLSGMGNDVAWAMGRRPCVTDWGGAEKFYFPNQALLTL